MSVGQWVLAAIALVAAGVTVYVNAPRRKVIVDEIAMLKGVTQPELQVRLQESIEGRVDRYLSRREGRVARRMMVIHCLGALSGGMAVVAGLVGPTSGSVVLELGAAGAGVNLLLLVREWRQLRRARRGTRIVRP